MTTRIKMKYLRFVSLFESTPRSTQARVHLDLLMAVLKYNDNTDSLCAFNQESHKTKQVVDGTRIKLACGESSLALWLGYTKMAIMR